MLSEIIRLGSFCKGSRSVTHLENLSRVPKSKCFLKKQNPPFSPPALRHDYHADTAS